PDQAIYSFRGASLDFFLRFKDDWPGAVVKHLAVNYRSASNIVRASQSLIMQNKKRFDLTPAPKRPGGRVGYVECGNEAGINSCIIKDIEAKMGGLRSLTAGDGSRAARFSDFAVLYRTRSSAKSLVKAFRSSGLPYHLVTPPGPEIEEFLERLQSQSHEGGLTVAGLIERESDAAGLCEGLRELLLWLAIKYGEAGAGAEKNLPAFIAEARALGDNDVPQIKADKVNLMTLHASKGLEFKTVFIAGLEDGLLPLGRKDSSLEEERRLFYVGLTRASEEVVLLGAKKRRFFGEVVETRPSPFIAELGDSLEKTFAPPPKKHVRRAVQKGLFD
ncbi:MAG: 3'-5' exonuclease, partial [Thermodesulfobacteriota bacterium]